MSALLPRLRKPVLILLSCNQFPSQQQLINVLAHKLMAHDSFCNLCFLMTHGYFQFIVSVSIQCESLNSAWGYSQKFLSYLTALSSENWVKCRSQQETFQFHKVILASQFRLLVMCLQQLLSFWLIVFQYCPFSASFLNTSIFTIPRQKILQPDLFRKYTANGKKFNERHHPIVNSLFIFLQSTVLYTYLKTLSQPAVSNY